MEKTQFPSFSNIKISTETIIAVSNLNFNLNTLYSYLPVTEYIMLNRKRGRKKKKILNEQNKNLPVGSIISVIYKNNYRGVLLKKKTNKTYFLNCTTLVIVLEDNKFINVKMSKNGKFQMTGCKDNSHFIKSVEYIYKHIIDSERQTGEKIKTFKNNNETVAKIMFNIVLKNIDFKVGFSIQRDKLDTFISVHTDFTSHYEGSITTGVNIKIKSNKPYDPIVNCLEIHEDENILKKVDYEDYLSMLDEKDIKKEVKKQKFHTFLVFCSGSVIQSGSGPDMEKVYNEFMSIILKNKEYFEEKIDI